MARKSPKAATATMMKASTACGPNCIRTHGASRRNTAIKVRAEKVVTKTRL